jgi:sulfhydrogenase subunit beta (sulfur reductase)
VDSRMLPKERLNELVARLGSGRRLVAPVLHDGALRWRTVEAGETITLDAGNTSDSPKAMLLPQTEGMMRFGRACGHYADGHSSTPEETPTVLLGVRPCDAHSFLMLDRVFLEGRFRDAYYAARRKNTLVIVLACARPRSTCFCHALNGGPYDRLGADLFMRDAGDAYLIEPVTEQGREVFRELADRLSPVDEAHRAAAAEIEDRAMQRLRPVKPVAGIKKVLQGLFDSPVWAEIAEKCVACGTCTYLCPGCHCFTIEDRLRARDGERMRAWDSCMYPTFTLHASGHNPRPDQAARWRQRTMHKFAYLPENVGMYGCVGCGRCIQACPVRLDIRDVIRRVREVADQAVDGHGEAKA